MKIAEYARKTEYMPNDSSVKNFDNNKTLRIFSTCAIKLAEKTCPTDLMNTLLIFKKNSKYIQ